MIVNKLLKTVLLCATGSLYADTAKFSVVVIDESTCKPIPGVTVRANFKEDIGWRAWTESPCPDGDVKVTDRDGRCRLTGKTNCGDVCCWVPEPPQGYYAGRGWGHGYTDKNLFGVWQPDNLVATIRLQRVEHPIPLFVKRVELRNCERGIGGFDGTNCVLRFDLMKGEWLPPYGNGEVADLSIDSKLRITDRERKFRYATKRVEDVLFYELSNAIALGGPDDFICQYDANKMAGIKIREADDSGSGCRVVKTMGMRKVIAKNKNWHCEYFADMSRDRCYTFRIRSRRDDKGKLVEAYYGKIYGDFEFEGDDKKGLIGVKFLYYLNPTSLDRNLEWDKKNNLCPTAGKHESQQP